MGVKLTAGRQIKCEDSAQNGPKCTYTTSSNGLNALTHGAYVWHGPPENVYRHPKLDIVIEFTEDPDEFQGIVNAGKPDEETYSGTWSDIGAA